MSQEEITEKVVLCYGKPGTISIEYLRKAAAAKKLFGPIVDEILKKV